MAAYDRFLALCGLMAGLGFAVLALMISVDIVLRNLGILNFPWLLEVSEYVVYIATFLAAPWVLHQSAHVRVDVLLNLVPRGVAIAMEIVADLIGLATSLVFAYYSFRATSASFGSDHLIFKELVILEWPLLAAMPLSGLLLAIEFVRRLRRALHGGIEFHRMTDGL